MSYLSVFALPVPCEALVSCQHLNVHHSQTKNTVLCVYLGCWRGGYGEGKGRWIQFLQGTQALVQWLALKLFLFGMGGQLQAMFIGMLTVYSSGKRIGRVSIACLSTLRPWDSIYLFLDQLCCAGVGEVELAVVRNSLDTQ